MHRIVRGDGMVNVDGATAGSAVDGPSRHTLALHSTPHGWDAKLVSWLDAARVRGDKVVVEHAPGAAPEVHRRMADAGLDPAPSVRWRVELVDAGVLGTQCGGLPERWYAWHADVAGQAMRDGYAGLAMICGCGAETGW